MASRQARGKMFAFFFAPAKTGLASRGEDAYGCNTMNDLAILSKAELISRVLEHVLLLEGKDTELQSQNEQLQSQREQLRQLDIALQTKDQKIASLTQERDEYKLA
jgi:hypothetical protein